MNTLLKLSFLTLVFVTSACNEKVSPELQDASATAGAGSSGGGPSVTPDEYYFRIVNTADTMLNFKVHKTGAGNANTDCDITSTTALSSNAFRADPSIYDISCFYEAEELSMAFNGLAYSIQASPNTCTYVGYAPFSFYNFQPGDSTQTFDHITCGAGVGDAAARAAIGAIGGAVNVAQACDTYRSEEAGATTNATPTSEEELCNFNYSNMESITDGPNCDIGTLTINDYTVTLVDDDGDPATADVPEANFESRKVECGGKAYNCIEGAIKLVPNLATNTSGIDITAGSSTTALDKGYELPSTFTTWYSSRRYVNFRRDLASTNIEFGDSDRLTNDNDPDTSGTLANGYTNSFGDPTYRADYDPTVMLNYANNLRMDGTALVTAGAIPNAGFSYMRGPDSYGRALAAEPFLGLTGYKTNPFYAFYCFDNAFEIKARIRMVVRDWDRVLPTSQTSTSFERISDIDLGSLAIQDVPYTEETTGDPDSWNNFNDRLDWDDLLDMERDDSGVPYDPTITVWRPYPVAPYNEGFYNPYIFPMETDE